MPAENAAAATFAGIHNENEFYSHHYLSEIFSGDIRATVDRWREAADAMDPAGEIAGPPYARLRRLSREYFQFRHRFASERRHETRVQWQRAWFRRLLGALGYGWSPGNHGLEDGEVPVLSAGAEGEGQGDGRAAHSAGPARLLVFGAYDDGVEGDDPLALKPHRAQFHGETPPPAALLGETWNDVITRRIFGQAHPPRWVLLLSFNQVLLIERGKWTHNRLGIISNSTPRAG